MLIKDRNAVLDVYQEAAERQWVIPTFCSENLTTTEAVLTAAREHGDRIGVPDLPVTIALTNRYSHRSQSTNYTHTRKWNIGLKLFLADLEVLCGEDSPYADLKVMVHLDHIQPELDSALLEWDMRMFSSIMFDASTYPFEENIARTARFMEKKGRDIVVEGACDEIVDASGNEVSNLTTPDGAQKFVDRSGADFIVANLGTEHRASAAELEYRGDIAREIYKKIGPRIVLHGCSSVAPEKIQHLFEDGVCKVNIWTTLERDSSPALLRQLTANAAKAAGPRTAQTLFDEKLLGENADLASKAALTHFTTCYRQDIIFREMKKLTNNFLEMWYTL